MSSPIELFLRGTWMTEETSEDEAVALVIRDPSCLSKASLVRKGWVISLEGESSPNPGGGTGRGSRIQDRASAAAANLLWTSFKSPMILVGTTAEIPVDRTVWGSGTGLARINRTSEVPWLRKTWATCSDDLPLKLTSAMDKMWSPTCILASRSATPPGTSVLTTTPVLFPPTIPKPSPEPSLINSMDSTWVNSVFKTIWPALPVLLPSWLPDLLPPLIDWGGGRETVVTSWWCPETGKDEGGCTSCSCWWWWLEIPGMFASFMCFPVAAVDFVLGPTTSYEWSSWYEAAFPSKILSMKSSPVSGEMSMSEGTIEGCFNSCFFNSTRDSFCCG